MQSWLVDCGAVKEMLPVHVSCMCEHVVCEISRLEHSVLENLKLKIAFYLYTFVLKQQYLQNHKIVIAHRDN